MLIKRPKGCNITYNENHENGFMPLPVRQQWTTSPCGKWSVVECVSAWEPTPAEQAMLREGGVIEVGLLIPQQCGIMLTVVPAAEPLETPKLTTLVEDAIIRLDALTRFYERIVDEQHDGDPGAVPLDDRICDNAIAAKETVRSLVKKLRELA